MTSSHTSPVCRRVLPSMASSAADAPAPAAAAAADAAPVLKRAQLKGHKEPRNGSAKGFMLQAWFAWLDVMMYSCQIQWRHIAEVELGVHRRTCQ